MNIPTYVHCAMCDRNERKPDDAWPVGWFIVTRLGEPPKRDQTIADAFRFGLTSDRQEFTTALFCTTSCLSRIAEMDSVTS